MVHKKLNYVVIVVVALFAAALIAINISWPSQQPQLNRILARGELRVSAVASPLISFNKQGQASGFDYELAQRFADYLGVKLVVRERDGVNDLFSDLANNDADLLAAGLIYNEDRLDNALSGPTYYTVAQQLLYRMGNKRPRDLGDLGSPVWVTAGSAHARLLRQLKADKYPDLDIRKIADKNSSHLLQRLAKGEIDYVVSDSVSVAQEQHIHPNVTVAFEVTENQPLTWYLKRSEDSSLNAALLDFFNQTRETDTLARLEEKYFSHMNQFNYVDTKTFINAINTQLATYRPLFEKYAGKMDWQVLAAIAWQESHWNPTATSPTGVRGIMMLTRPTADFFGIEDRLDPEQSIKGGGTYINYLMDKLPDSIPEDEKIWFALAAYNMGYGHMLDVRKLTEMQGADPDSWLDVKSRLPLLSKKAYYQSLPYGYARGYEAYRYVEGVRRYQLSLQGYLDLHQEELLLQQPQEETAEILTSAAPD
ncbi:membrane-bound lytic murein transglycosylase MltF [Morganella morganii]|uniref:membrane-bound lytic murein transglycosylase MltF n=1 Tax=Morganella morganii TaxID=582 RepID=UPI003EC0B6F9